MEKELFLKALGLESPWYIKETKLDIERQRFDIYLDFKKGAKFADPETGEQTGVFSTENKTWKHLFFWQYPTYLHARVPKIKNTKTGSVKLINLSWARAGSGFTLLFEGMVLELAKHLPLSKLGEHVEENDKRLMRVVNYYVNKAKGKADYSNITRGGIDETSRRKGHNYISTFINFDTKKVSCIVKGKGKEAVEEIAKDIVAHGGDRNKIKEVSIDLSPAFTAGVKTSFPNAVIVYDKFHIIQILNNALNEVRQLEYKKNKILKGSKYLWLKDPKKLSSKKKKELEDLKNQNKILAEAYQMKENFKEFFEKETKEQAELFLKLWCDWVDSSGIEAMKKVVKSVKAHWHGIITYIEKRTNNGIVEGLNSIIQTIKRQARGYKNIDNFMNMIYLKIGDFEICQVGILPQ